MGTIGQLFATKWEDKQAKRQKGGRKGREGKKIGGTDNIELDILLFPRQTNLKSTPTNLIENIRR